MGNHRQLTLADREQLEALHLEGQRAADIAGALGVHVATVYKELQRGDTGRYDKNMNPEYSAKLAQARHTEKVRNRRRQTTAAAKN